MFAIGITVPSSVNTIGTFLLLAIATATGLGSVSVFFSDVAKIECKNR